MPRAVVVLPSTTYRAGDFVRAAESLGIDLVVASEQPSPLEMSDRFVEIDCSDPERAAEAVAGLGDVVPLDGVVAADDAGVLIAAIAASKLGLLANEPDAALATRDKALMRQRLARGEVPQPDFRIVDDDDVPHDVRYPAVVKPVDRSASQGVIRVDDAAELLEALRRARRIVGDAKASILVEEFVPGAEVAVEGLLRDGELTVLAVFDKPDTEDGPYFPETIFVTPSRLSEEIQAECVRVAEAALRSLDLVHGPVHIELRVDADRPRVIEVAARSIGGLCSRSLNFGLMGTSLESLILRNALGMDKPELRREEKASGVLMIPIPRSGELVSVEGLDQTRNIEHVTGFDLSIQPGAHVAAPPDGDAYLGFVYASAAHPAQVEAALRKAKDTIGVIVR